MPLFAYKAARANRTLDRGTISGSSPREARQLLRTRGLTVQELREQAVETTHRQVFSGLWRGSTKSQLAASLSELATLLGVGVPLLEGLETLIEQYSGRFKLVLMHLRDDIASGSSLADAMRRQDRVFDALSVSMVEVGENTGSLDQVLAQLAEFKRRSLEFKNRVLSAVLYPMIVLGVSLIVCVFLMSVVVPMLLENLVEAGRPLPWPTQVLKAVSDLLVAHGLWVLVSGMVLVAAVVLLLRTDGGRRAVQRSVLRLPILGSLSRKQELSRVALVVATLISSGVELLKAIEIASRTTRNLLLQDALRACGELIGAGKELGQVMSQQSYFPPMVAQIFAMGQKSGQLEPMLMRLSKDYDAQVNSAAARLASVLEPLLILCLSVFVGFILFATLLPILEAGNAL